METPLQHSFNPVPEETPTPAPETKQPEPAPEQTISEEEWKRKIEASKAEAAKIVEAAVPTKPEEPKEEQTPPQEPTKESKAANASTILFTDIGTDEEFQKTFEAERDADPRSDEEKEDDPSEKLLELALCSHLGMRTRQQRLLTKFVQELNKHTDELNKLKQCIKELGLSKVKPSVPTSKEPKVLTGDAALAAVISRTKGVYRIPLYNSGFQISVKPPSLTDLDAFIREVNVDVQEFGRVLGSHYHLVFNIWIKRKLMDLVCDNIISSNFDEFRSRSALMEAISLHDYETIAWAFCTMMYSDGINIGVYCTNPDCRHKDEHQFVDLARCCYINHDVLTKDALSWMLEGLTTNVTRTIKDLEYYRTKVLKSGQKVITDKSGDNNYTLEVPSMARYFAIGTEVFNNIVETVHGEKNMSKQELSNAITYNLYKMLTPWVAKLSMMDKGVTQFITSDSKAIMESLDVGYGETADIYGQFEEFIKDTRVAYFGAISLKCPVCGKVPNFTKDNMLLFDMEQVFFGLSYLRLGRIG